ncbi:MAG: DUF1700 domain-containing protein [Lachnospiraceae bacterium]|nr:DUF1700 domain-containing protein [Lachnospiraceae bacterium]
MKKEEYLNQLAQGLRAYDKSYVEDILRDYEEHFFDAAQRGKQEEEICKELGSPEDVVREIREMLLEEERDCGLARPQADLMYLGEKVKEGEEGFRWAAGDLKSIRFFTDTARVRLIPSRDGTFHLHLSDEKDREYLEQRCTADGYYGQLKRKWWQIFGTKFFFQPFGEVLLEIPEGVAQLQVSAVTGEVSAEAVHAQSIRLSSISRHVSAWRIRGEEISLSTVSGKVLAKEVKAGKLTLRDTNGAIYCEELQAEELLGKTVSGCVEAYRVESQDIHLKTVSGAIRLEVKPHSAPIQFRTRTVSGQVCIQDTAQYQGRGEALDSQENIRAVLESVSGNITVTGMDQGGREETQG